MHIVSCENYNFSALFLQIFVRKFACSQRMLQANIHQAIIRQSSGNHQAIIIGRLPRFFGKDSPHSQNNESLIVQKLILVWTIKGKTCVKSYRAPLSVSRAPTRVDKKKKESSKRNSLVYLIRSPRHMPERLKLSLLSVMAHPPERLANLDKRSTRTAKDKAELAAKGPRLPGVIMTHHTCMT